MRIYMGMIMLLLCYMGMINKTVAATVNGCIMRVYWFYSLLSFSVVHSSSFFLAFITVAVVCVMDLVVWNKRGLDLIGLV